MNGFENYDRWLEDTGIGDERESNELKEQRLEWEAADDAQGE